MIAVTNGLCHTAASLGPEHPHLEGEDGKDLDAYSNKIIRCFRHYQWKKQEHLKNCYAFSIQKTFRNYRIRKKTHRLPPSFKMAKQRRVAASKVQATIRGMLTRESLRKRYEEKMIEAPIYSPLDYRNRLELKKERKEAELCFAKDSKAAQIIQKAWIDSKKRTELVKQLYMFPETLNGFRKQVLTNLLVNYLHATRDIHLSREIRRILMPISHDTMYRLVMDSLLHFVKEPFCRAGVLADPESIILPKNRKLYQIYNLDKNRDFQEKLALCIAKIQKLFLCRLPFFKKNPKHLVFFTQGHGRGHRIAAESFAQILRKKGYTIAIYDYAKDTPDETCNVLGYEKPLTEVAERLDRSTDIGKKRAIQIDEIYHNLQNYYPFRCESDFSKFLKKHQIVPSASFIFGPSVSRRAITLSNLYRLPMGFFITDFNEDLTLKYERLVSNPRDKSTYLLLAPENKPVLTEEVRKQYSQIFGTDLESIPRDPIDVGFPVRASFGRVTKEEKIALKKQMGIDTASQVVMITGGGLGYFSMLENLKKIVQSPKGTFVKPLHLVMITGENKKLYQETTRYIESLAGSSFTFSILKKAREKQMADYMKVSDIMIGKTGGSTSAECYATGLRVLPVTEGGLTWEKNNQKFLKENGLIVGKGKDLVKDLSDALSKDFEPEPIREPASELDEIVEALQKNYQGFESNTLSQLVSNIFRVMLQQGVYEEAEELIDSPYANLDDLEIIVGKVYEMRKHPRYREMAPPLNKEEYEYLLNLISECREVNAE